jgi:hypothetical protein
MLALGLRYGLEDGFTNTTVGGVGTQRFFYK